MKRESTTSSSLGISQPTAPMDRRKMTRLYQLLKGTIKLKNDKDPKLMLMARALIRRGKNVI